MTALFAMALAAGSQTLGGSAYSAFGIGDLQSPAFGAYASMGGVGIGARNPYAANTINPAGINAFQAGTEVLDIGFYAGILNQSTSELRESKGDGGLSHLNILIKPKPTVGVSLGIRQVSKVSYNLTSTNISDPDLGLLDIDYEGSGGLNQIDLGTAFQLTEGLNLGIRGSLLFGSINETESVSSTSEVRRFAVLNRQVYAKAMFDVGMQYEKAIADSKLVFGATWNPGFEAFSRSAQVISNDAGDTLLSPLTSHLTIPQRFGLGASLMRSNVIVNVDFSYELWEVQNSEAEGQFRNVLKAGVGLEYVIDPTSVHYGEQIRWRAGFRSNNYYQKINNELFGEFAFTAGFGLPAMRGGSMINFGYEYNLRGTTANELIREVGHVFSMSFTFRELWFRKPKY